MRHARAMVAAVTLLAGASAAAAQSPGPPGPWVLDVRGATSPVPEEPAFYPPFHESALIPTRGFGLEGGAHVYLFPVGRSRLGVGAGVAFLRGLTRPPDPVPSPGSPPTTAPAAVQDVQIDLRLIAPQVSFNFGTRDGWSYVSAGVGTAQFESRTAGVLAGHRRHERVRAINAGGGARWFLASHLAFGFDIRLHRLAEGTAGPVQPATPPDPGPDPDDAPAATPGQMLLVVGVGLSFR